jgi:quercetin dioxygenase-like cupin family protein
MIVPRENYENFAEQGYIGPIRVLTPDECESFLRAVSDAHPPPPLDWEKGHAATSRAFFEISTHPQIMEVLLEILGEDIMIWGASIQSRCPDSVHPWHSDIESSSSAGKTVSVWIGLENTCRDSSLLIVPNSHRFGVTVQEERHKFDKAREETTSNDVLRWAQGRDKRSYLLRPDMADGDVLFFDGRLWHGSHNLSDKTRQALLLQYSTSETVIRIPDLNYLDWPFRQLDLPKPPCVLIRGSSESCVNRFVPAPVAMWSGWVPRLTSRVYRVAIPLLPEADSGWKPYPIFDGTTGNLENLSSHVSVLTQNSCPHPAHSHGEEEILMLLTGEVDLILQNEKVPEGFLRKHLKPGEFVFYPANFSHTLETTSEDPAHYVMFKWYSNRSLSESGIPFGHFCIFNPAVDSEDDDGFGAGLVFEGPTTYLRKLHCHTSALSPGAGYEPHVDAYDVGIVVIEGEVETLNERVGPHGVIFYPGGEPHGMYNPGNVTAKYVVFEFHKI